MRFIRSSQCWWRWQPFICLGKREFFLNFGAMALANTITMLEVIRAGGIAEFFRQFMELMMSFAGQTGDLMIRMEGTNLPYSFGAFFVFFLLTVTARKKEILVLYGAVVVLLSCFV